MRFHFILTLQWQTAVGLSTETQHGTVAIPADLTREKALQGLIEQMRRGRDGMPVVLFFAFEANEIGGGA
ncbi:hypothetical protein [Actinomadura sp. WAC 06369]|uniref:hypothetical protein n=1 Tax=Actinomadura sp. WAC 06369 TaxID=2203193 RepID=UPI000F782163|nr:hypothetical protein [Actinomadura sp. WAC 06369]RSN71356.1 hypothetical protein DMH08_02845 [Actinomadura sp. WAC 06369]